MKKIEIKETKLSRVLNVVSRWVVGLVFIFSSFVKGVDPMGTMFKVEDYMTSWELFGSNFEWALPLAGVLSVALICMEFLIGVLLIANAFRVLTSWLLAAMMAFFTVTTFVDALTDLVDDCGCFGDAIKLTNWETFWKNVVLDVFTVVIFLTRKHGRRRMERDLVIVLSAVIAMVVFCFYNIKHEPVIDFRPWKIGNRMIDVDKDATPRSFVTYRNTRTGEQSEFESSRLVQLMADSVWVAEWEWVASRVEMPEVKAPGFSMMDEEGNDYALDMVASPDGLLMVTVHHLGEVDDEGCEEIAAARTMAVENGMEIVLLTSALPEDVEQWRQKRGFEDIDTYYADATAIETIMRGNPGFIVLRDAVVVDKGRKARELKF